MEQLITKKFKMLYPSEQKLKKFGFKKVKDIDGDLWRYSFPVYKYNHKIPVIDCVVSVVLPGGKVILDVYSNGSIYTPFYNNEFGNYEPLMNVVNNNILRELSKLDIKEKRRKK